MKKIFVFDDERRLKFVTEAIKGNFPEYNVRDREISKQQNIPSPEGVLTDVAAGKYDLIVGFAQGSPSAK
jgi:hypothetical protein